MDSSFRSVFTHSVTLGKLPHISVLWFSVLQNEITVALYLCSKCEECRAFIRVKVLNNSIWHIVSLQEMFAVNSILPAQSLRRIFEREFLFMPFYDFENLYVQLLKHP